MEQNQELIEVKCEPSQVLPEEEFPVIKIEYDSAVKVENDISGVEVLPNQCERRPENASVMGMHAWQMAEKAKAAAEAAAMGQSFKIENCSGTYVLVQADGCAQGQPATCNVPHPGQERLAPSVEYPYRDNVALQQVQEIPGGTNEPVCYSYVLVNQTPLTVLESTAAFDCNVCGLVFTDMSLLNSHKAIHCGSDVSNASSNESRYSCGICDASFESATELQSHAMELHGQSERREDGTLEGPRYEPCQECQGSGVIILEDNSETADTTKPFQCKICNKTFTRYSSLWSHKKLHSGDKPFKCDFCGVEFAKLPYLQSHVRVHTGDKPFKCSVCGMQFTQSQHLKNHERIHSGEKPFECEVCKKTFARHSTLWNHRRIHTGDRPYHCDVCGMAFSQKTHLNNHANTHQEEKLYRCTLCGLDFGYKTTLTRHLKVRHSGENVDSQVIALSPTTDTPS